MDEPSHPLTRGVLSRMVDGVHGLVPIVQLVALTESSDGRVDMLLTDGNFVRVSSPQTRQQCVVA